MLKANRGRAEFLNVDLDLTSRSGLKELLDELEPNVFILHRSARRASVELRGQPRSAEVAVRGIVRLVRQLSPEGKRAWNRCSLREANLGLQSGARPRQLVVPLSAQALRDAASISLRLAITDYAPERA
jgi:hypothetical protein